MATATNNTTRTLLAAFVLVVAAGGCGGCASYMGVKRELLDQAGIAIDAVDRSLADRLEAERAVARLERERLDAGFERDVRSRHRAGGLDEAWSIDHGRAYAVGIDALHRRTRDAEARAATDRANLRAAAAAVEQVARLTALEARLLRERGRGDGRD